MQVTNQEACSLRGVVFRRWQVYLLWPAILLCAYASLFGNAAFLNKGLNERVGLVLLGMATSVSLARWLGEKRPWFLILLGLNVALFCRELHFAGTSRGIYVALLAVVAWSALWWWQIARDLHESDTTPDLLFALATYALSRAVAERAFQGILPMESESDLFRSGLEELFENLAHLVMLVVTLRGLPSDDPTDEESVPPSQPHTDEAHPSAS